MTKPVPSQRVSCSVEATGKVKGKLLFHRIQFGIYQEATPPAKSNGKAGEALQLSVSMYLLFK